MELAKEEDNEGKRKWRSRNECRSKLARRGRATRKRRGNGRRRRNTSGSSNSLKARGGEGGGEEGGQSVRPTWWSSVPHFRDKAFGEVMNRVVSADGGDDT